MIEEIVNFEKSLQTGEGKKLIEQEGLYIYLTFEGDNLNPHIILNEKNRPNNTDYLQNCFERYQYVDGFNNPNKRFDGYKSIVSCSAYSVVITKENFIKRYSNDEWNTCINNFFLKAKDFVPEEDSNYLSLFEKYLQSQLKNDLDNYERELNNASQSAVKYKTIFVFLDLPIDKYKIAWNNFSKNIKLNSDENNLEIKLEKNYIQSGELINFDIGRKPFMAHYTAIFFDNYKTKSEDQTYIKSFFKSLKSKDIFPKPLPIFIDKKELNYKVVSIYQANKDKMSYSDIFEEIYNTDKGIEMNDLQNYYLLYVNNNQGKIEIKDFEFVPSFNYKFECSIFPIFETESEITPIKNIFDFQRIIVRELFDNCLIKIDEKGKYTQNYWGTVESKYYKSQNNYRLILQYRKSFYDFIYKSKKESIKPRILRDIVLSSIIDTLQDEKYRTTNKSKEERIKTLLNIYFSINQYFDPENINFNKIDIPMETKTKDLLVYVQELVSNEDKHLEEGNDIEFAYAFGQLVYYLLSQSEASNKTHSLLLSYLQKSDFELLKEKAKEDFTKYSYKISFNNKKFNKICSEIFAYKPKSKFSDLVSFFLAGYFSKNSIY